MATAAGPIRPAELVLWARRGEDRTLVSNGDTVLALDGPAHDMWWALLHLGTIAKAAAHLAHVYDAPAGELAAGLAELVDELSRRGILAGASAA